MDVRTLFPPTTREEIDEFRPGDTVIVNVAIREGERARTQAFQGNVIRGSYSREAPPAPGAMFTVRRVSYGIGVERMFPYSSSSVESVKVIRRGRVRRSRLYYLRGLTGKKARIKERRDRRT